MHLLRIPVVCLWLTLQSAAWADLDINIVKSRVITGVANPRVVGNVILYDGDQLPKVTPAAQITVTTDFKFIRVKARTSLFEATNLEQVSDKVYLLTGAGKYAIEVIAFDPEKGIDERIVPIELSDVQPGPDDPQPGPGPGPGPGPDIPPDPFDNLGQKIAKATLNLPKKAEVAKIYRDGAKDLRENQSLTVNGIFDRVFNLRSAAIVNDADKWKPFVELLTVDIKNRWPMSRLGLAEYFDIVAVGLGDKK